MGKVYASSDWHGCWNVAKQVFDFLQPDDILIFIGDAIDRGPDGWRIMKELFNDERVIYLQGNHEKMMADAINSFITLERMTMLWFANGGEQTWKDIENFSDDLLMGIVKMIYKMPTKYVYKSPKGHTVILEHAGYTPFDTPHRSHDPLWDREHFYDSWDGNWGYEEKSEVETGKKSITRWGWLNELPRLHKKAKTHLYPNLKSNSALATSSLRLPGLPLA